MKKVLALVLAVALAIGMAPIAFANVVGGEHGNRNVVIGWSSVNHNLLRSSNGSYLFAERGEGVLSRIPNANVFERADRLNDLVVQPNTDANPDVELLVGEGRTHADIGVRYRAAAGRNLVHSVTLQNKTNTYQGEIFYYVVARVRFNKEFVSVKSQDFEIEVYLTDRRGSGVETDNNRNYVTLAGKVENREEDVRGDDYHLFTGDGRVAVGTEFARNVIFEAGNGVEVKLNVFEDAKYYCRAVMDISTADQAVLEREPKIEGVLTMRTARSNNATFRSASVNLGMDGTYYVYDQDGNFLGMSDKKDLPFADKYWLATDRITLNAGSGSAPVDPDEVPVIEPGDAQGPNMGGDSSTPSNANNNPGTGR